ncbi:hypothetical protein G6O67_003062 [Ophiocordyceps sinensis]|uniref:Uncharacterized protein n=1 Tax=Ophiocordyceps sinensis TaxID=72228 RepID=A0A8H4PVN8_9HYPO|nr:hypothetical protein G6O67_003062 [Ophiocordyceps sinensis]
MPSQRAEREAWISPPPLELLPVTAAIAQPHCQHPDRDLVDMDRRADDMHTIEFGFELEMVLRPKVDIPPGQPVHYATPLDFPADLFDQLGNLGRSQIIRQMNQMDSRGPVNTEQPWDIKYVAWNFEFMTKRLLAIFGRGPKPVAEVLLLYHPSSPELYRENYYLVDRHLVRRTKRLLVTFGREPKAVVVARAVGRAVGDVGGQ